MARPRAASMVTRWVWARTRASKSSPVPKTLIKNTGDTPKGLLLFLMLVPLAPLFVPATNERPGQHLAITNTHNGMLFLPATCNFATSEELL